MGRNFDIKEKAKEYAEDLSTIYDKTPIDLIEMCFIDGATCMKKEIAEQLHIVVGAMILDGYDEYDYCVKFVNEYIKELEDGTGKS